MRELDGEGVAIHVGPESCVRVREGAPSLSTSGETLTIEESMTLRARTENAGHAGDEHERSWSWSSG
jgi:hypothetical protein